MRAAIFFLILLAVFAPITATANEKQANALHETEVRGISSLAPARLEDMITASVAASGVEFSTSWLDKQAVARGVFQRRFILRRAVKPSKVNLLLLRLL
jgi:hypothetical protein